MSRRVIAVALALTAVLSGAGFRMWREVRNREAEEAARVSARCAMEQLAEVSERYRIAELFVAGNPALGWEVAELYADFVQEAADRYQLPAKVIAGLVYVESRADARAVNRDCLGLTQVRWSVWGNSLRESNAEVRSSRDLFVPRKSILAGAWVLRHYFDSYKDLYQALYRYSGGKRDYPDMVLTLARSL